MKFAVVDLTSIENLNFRTKLDNKSIFDILQDNSYLGCAFVVEQKHLDSFHSMLMESVFDVFKISVWIRASLTASEMFYASRTQKNCCCFIFWLSASGFKYPKDFPLNFYIEKYRKNGTPDWLNSTREVMSEYDIDFELLTTSGLTLNGTREDERRDLF